MLSDLNCETSFRILSPFHNILTTSCMDLHNLICWPSIVISKISITFGPVKANIFWENKLYHVDQREITHQNRGAHVEKLKQVEK